MSRWNLAWLVGIPAVAIVGLTIAYTAPSREKDRNYDMVRLLVETLDEVQQNYVRELDAEARRKLVEDMINGGLGRLDPHSSYMNPKEFKQFTTQSRGKFGGIGIQIQIDRKTGYLQVLSPMVGTPAYEAGVQAGDLVMKIEGKSTEDMTIDQAVELIQGEPGQKITLNVLHEGAKEAVDLEMARAIIEVPTIMGDLRKPDNVKEWEFLIDKDNKIGYVRLLMFNENSAEELKAALEQLKREGMRGLVLDLRTNPGGQLSAAVEVTNCFITEGRIVSTKGRNEKERMFDARPSGAVLVPPEDYPLVVLVNRWSASASEIVSAALQDHKRAVIIGERSYGKGSVQNILKMENDTSALKLTTSSYWRPSGKNIHRFPDSKETDDWGVLPNPGFEIKLTDEERIEYAKYRRDRDIVHGKSGANPPAKADKEEKPKKPFTDRVLEKALEHLRAEVNRKK